jgi:hypothetical protein
VGQAPALTLAVVQGQAQVWALLVEELELANEESAASEQPELGWAAFAPRKRWCA